VTAQTLGSDEDKGGGSAVLRTLPPEPKPDKIRRTCRHRKETPGGILAPSIRLQDLSAISRKRRLYGCLLPI
jgi:hypothetical protein